MFLTHAYMQRNIQSCSHCVIPNIPGNQSDADIKLLSVAGSMAQQQPCMHCHGYVPHAVPCCSSLLRIWTTLSAVSKSQHIPSNNGDNHYTFQQEC